MRSVSSALVCCFLAYRAGAHGTVDSVAVGNTNYLGYPPTNSPGTPPNPAEGVVWASNDFELGFVLPEDYGNSNIICHKNASPAPKAADVAAGQSLSLSWPNWPAEDPHPGVLLNYLAPAGTDDPTKIDANSLQFFKISEFGYDSSVDVNGADKGLATGSFKRAGRVAQVQIPANIKPGLYVLRHEIIALHAADLINGAQNYPQCLTIKVSGSGTASPAGIPATQFYKSTDPGLLVPSFYDNWNPKAYIIPGPGLWNGASTGTISTVVSALPIVGAGSASITPSASITDDTSNPTATGGYASASSDGSDSGSVQSDESSSDSDDRDVDSSDGSSSELVSSVSRNRTRDIARLTSSSPSSTTLATVASAVVSPIASLKSAEEEQLSTSDTSTAPDDDINASPSASSSPARRRRPIDGITSFGRLRNERRHAGAN